jgi:L-2-hydroxyglutarate oxidase
MTDFEVAVVGGGIVGLATALALTERGRNVVVLEKENRWAAHQTGRNSGVIHSGIYYTPGGLKARLCVQGARETTEFCAAEKLPVDICGKLIVAVDGNELPALDRLAERGKANGVGVTRLDAAGLREYEPHVTGIAGLHIASTGICDFGAIARRFAGHIDRAGGELRLNTTVTALDQDDEHATIRTDNGQFTARQVVVCAGLRSGQLDETKPAHILPFRGEYYELKRHDLVRNLIYPVPDPAYPFLGLHLTRMIDGSRHVGPNAILSLAQEKYRKSSFSARDTAALLGYPGFWRLARKHWRTGAAEIARSLSKHRFAAAARRLVPDVQVSDLTGGGAGIRAQAVGRDGSLLDDFVFSEHGRVLHVLNAPSPAATAALPIGRELADILERRS